MIYRDLALFQFREKSCEENTYLEIYSEIKGRGENQRKHPPGESLSFILIKLLSSFGPSAIVQFTNGGGGG